jgi:hypothetical protein
VIKKLLVLLVLAAIVVAIVKYFSGEEELEMGA